MEERKHISSSVSFFCVNEISQMLLPILLVFPYGKSRGVYTLCIETTTLTGCAQKHSDVDKNHEGIHLNSRMLGMATGNYLEGFDR